ncbi:vacuolar sorting protein 39 [Actinidia rufa]|uniref:Vacuolar sorting protein 39 n=1 Tax=Actinidia rufa TaxID=165716 RepID=A0A7J0FTR3_9ERIC|nr:vacuolar sorting protein 39 [Actinidia rufa]
MLDRRVSKVACENLITGKRNKNLAKEKERISKRTSEGRKATGAPTAAVSESGMLKVNTFCLRTVFGIVGAIVHNLSRAIDIDASLGRMEERSRHVQINDESLCDSCHARLGTKLFAMYPDDTIVCYKVSNIDISYIVYDWKS